MPDTAPQPAQAPAGAPRRKRPPPRRVTVERVERLTPRVISVTFGGVALENFGPPRPGAHMKLLFAPPGFDMVGLERGEEGPRPPSRTYTPRRYDPATRRLDVEFVLHGDGLAAGWVQKAKAGDALHVAGPGGGYDIPADLSELILIADDTAMPAAATILEALPASAKATVVCEVADAKEERPLTSKSAVEPEWLHYATAGAQPGTLLEKRALELAAAKPDAHWWIACEAGAMRRIRKHLLGDRRVAPAKVHTRGYWKLGETNYPDHDYGND
jgi:NADPH-dependent ferric siderophore reductase